MQPVTLEGVLSGSADEHWILTCTTGRKVRLEGHPQLDLMEAGAIIRVEGQLQDGTQPHCQVQSLRLIKRAS